MEVRRLGMGVLAIAAVGMLWLGSAGRGDAQTSPLPPGHPPAGGSAPLRPPPPGSGTGAQGLTWKAPSGWVSEKPSSSMRRAQYRVPGPGGPAECVVFYFGPGEGGDPKANADRWAGQFRGPEGSSAGPAVNRRELTVEKIPVLLVEITGTYVGGMGGQPGPPQPNFMLLGAVAQGPDANWFFRAIGPRATLEAQRKAFEGLVRSIRPGKTS